MKNNPFDAKILIVIIGASFFYFGWDQRLKNKYPEHYSTQTQGSQKAESQVQGENTPTSLQGVEPSLLPSSSLLSDSKKPVQKVLSHKTKELSFVIDSMGMAIKNIVIEKYKKDFDPKSFFYKIQINGVDVPFSLSKEGNTFIGIYQDKNLYIKREMKVEGYKIESKISYRSSVNAKLSFYSKKNKNIRKKTDIYGIQEEYFVLDSQKSSRIFKTNKTLNKEAVSIFSINSTYFTRAIVDKKSDSIPSLETKVNSESVESFFSYALISKSSENKNQKHIENNFIIAPKKISILQKENPRMVDSINFGIFSFLGFILLKLLNFFYSFLGNYGWAIVALTFLVRLLILPFNIMSMKSMARMQKIQPKIQEIKATYKDDAQVMNQKVLAAMRENKANPISGCLPLLLQLPIFFAMYQIFLKSTELYGENFIFWVTNLSQKDPYYVLPVLTGLVMFLQQYLTPMATVNETQRKMLLLMPCLFTLFMLVAPSGINVYLFVSTAFGVAQQYFVKRQQEATSSVRPVVAK